MNEIKKALYRMAASSAEREPLQTKKGLILSILKFFFPVLFIVALAVADFWIYISPLWYMVIAIGAGFIYFVAFILAQISGQVRGAKYALQNPRNGETWIEITDDGESIWTSEKFIPAPALPEPVQIELAELNKKTLPKTTRTWERWRRIYALYNDLKTGEKRNTEQEIFVLIEKEVQDEYETITLRTLTEIKKLGKLNGLVTVEKYEEITGITLK